MCAPDDRAREVQRLHVRVLVNDRAAYLAARDRRLGEDDRVLDGHILDPSALEDLDAVAQRLVDQLRVRVDVGVPVEGLIGGVEVGLWRPVFEQQCIRDRAGR